MFEQNTALLERAVETHALIRPVSNHRLPDGTLDVEGNLRLWNEVMKPFDKILLWKQPVCRGELQGEPCLIPVPAREHVDRPVILIAHGGGFRWRTGCEAANVALWFRRHGYSTAILSYRLQPHSRMESFADMQCAVRLLRQLTEEIGHNGKVIAMGFSAGGMLAANCATLFDAGNPESDDPADWQSSRPDAAVVCYGAMSATAFPQPFGIAPDDALFGASREERCALSAERQIRTDTPPMFLWQTMSDDGRHGMNLASALQAMGVPYELHIFQAGVHGLALADGENDLGMISETVSRWPELCLGWLKENGL
ncbi:MAG TPA: alpha/beta hydrolase [Feifaniaceae bacterium]|nr:alpha/beta hydrolase [Feifaniaceae bacterium]